ncbi:MAG: hypothetical protein ACRDYX_22840 [Egibacteraceae bacterium]
MAKARVSLTAQEFWSRYPVDESDHHDFQQKLTKAGRMQEPGDVMKYVREVAETLERLGIDKPVTVIRASATALPLPDASQDAVITDPPYYDNVSYADISDFFSVWLERSVGFLHPDHLGGELTPKRNEIVANADRLLEVCPTSYAPLGVCKTVAQVPLRQLRDAGVPVALGADDPLLFGTGLAGQYALVRDALGFGDADLAELARCSIRGSAAPDGLEAQLLAGVDAWLGWPERARPPTSRSRAEAVAASDAELCGQLSTRS